MRNDLRTAIQQFRRQPAFFAGAALSLAIGMSLATAVFSVVESTLLRPLKFPQADRLVSVIETVPALNADYAYVDPEYVVALRDQATTLADVAAFDDVMRTVGESGEARSLRAALVTPNYFGVLGVRPLRGQLFDEATSRPGSRAVIISYALWQSRLGRSPNAIGTTIRLSGVPHTIIGIMPDGFSEPRGARLWLPVHASILERQAATGSDVPMYNTVARLEPGATLAAADAEARVLHDRLFANQRNRNARGARVMSHADFLTRGIRDTLRMWGVAAALVMILCAVNFATMSLARGMRRRAEIAVRVTLGASRARIARLLLTEATLMALASGLLAVLLGWWMLTYADALLAEGTLELSTDMRWPTVLFGVVMTGVVGFVFALAPALELGKVDLRSALTGASGATTMKQGELRGRRALVALQLSLALTAVAVVTSLIRADARAWAVGTGFDHELVVLADVTPNDSTAKQMASAPLIERVAAMTGAQHVGAVRGGEMVVGWYEDQLDRGFRAIVKDVSDGYFRALGLPLLAGRMPTAEEIVSRTDVVVATWYRRGDGADPSRLLGRRVRIKPPGKAARWVTVIGVVPPVTSWSLGVLGATYYTVGHKPLEAASTLVARVDGSPQLFANAMAAALVSFDAGLRVSDARTAASVVEREWRATRGRAVFLTGVGALAMLLAIVGLYGLTSYTTEMRARELAIRTALGARAPQLARVAFSELWWMAAVGILVAVLVSGRVTAWLDSMFRNPMLNIPLVTLAPLPTAITALVLLLIMACGTIVPLRRVLKLDVMRTVQG